MLEGLDKITWSELHHANGIASEVPNWIRDLLSEDSRTRVSASHELFESLQHEGAVYDATFYAIPFLFELLKFPSTPEKDMIAVLITHINTGYQRTVIQANNISDNETRSQRRLTQSVHLTIEKELHLLYPYMRCEKQNVRSVIALMLRLFPNLSNETIPLLEQALKSENDINTRKTMEYAIKVLNETKQ